MQNCLWEVLQQVSETNCFAEASEWLTPPITQHRKTMSQKTKDKEAAPLRAGLPKGGERDSCWPPFPFAYFPSPTNLTWMSSVPL
jgi:hypothetical protein